MVSLVLLAFSLLLFFFFQIHRTAKKPNFPPGPRRLPIIGNLHQLDNSALTLNLQDLSKKYGPLFSLQLGLRPTIVISSPKLAKEVMKTQDLQFCSRPSLISQMKFSYNGKDMAFSPYNDYWREMRKISVLHILSSKRVSTFSPIRKYEVDQMMRKISEHASSSRVVNLNEMLMSLTSTIICRIAFGRRYEGEGIETSKLQGMFKEMQDLMIAFFLTDYVPFLGWIDKLTGLMARLEKSFKEMEVFYQDVIDEHLDPKRQKPEEEDIVDVLLQLKQRNSFSMDLTHDHIKAIIMNIFVAGTQPTAATLVWVMTLLMKNPRVLQKVQTEVRNLCAGKGFIEEDDIQKLTYLKAVIKETLRLYPPTPLLLPRETTKKCFIEGYEIPEKTLVYVNAWAIHRDPEAWKEPEEFCPERFLDNAIDLRGQDFELIPFGAGRRMCPALHMGIAMLELTLANLLYAFDWVMPAGMKREDIDTEMLVGLGQRKKNPLCLVAQKRM